MMPRVKVSGRFVVLVLFLALGGATWVRGTETVRDTGKSGDERASSSAAMTGEQDYHIQVDDILMIDGHRHAELSPLREYAVAKNGTIKLSHLGRVKAVGLTKGELEEKLEKLYDPRYFKSLVVTVEVKSKSYNIGGEVRSPGIKTLVLKTTVLTAVLGAGGPTDYAALDKVTVSRMTGKKTVQHRINCESIIKGKAPDDFLLQPNDFVWVPRSKGIFGL